MQVVYLRETHFSNITVKKIGNNCSQKIFSLFITQHKINCIVIRINYQLIINSHNLLYNLFYITFVMAIYLIFLNFNLILK